MCRAGARVKITRSIQIGNSQPKQNLIHDEHMRKELQSQPVANSSTRQASSASASTQGISGAAERRLPHRMHAPAHGACSLLRLSHITVELAEFSQYACLDRSVHLPPVQQSSVVSKHRQDDANAPWPHAQSAPHENFVVINIQCCLDCLRVSLYATSGLGKHQQDDVAQLGEALKTVQAKIGSSLTAPQRPLLDLGIGMSYELDTNDFALLVRHIIACN